MKRAINYDGLFAPPFTFMGVPYGHDLTESHAAIIGLPFDMGTHPHRVGSREGPKAIRDQSYRIRPFHPPDWDHNPIEILKLIDCGDIRLSLSDIEEAFASIELGIERVLNTDTIPVTMGGDGSVALPELRSLSRKHSRVSVLHIDAHTDTARGEGRDMAAGSVFTRAVNEGLVDPTRSVHFGIRGTQKAQGSYNFARSLGYEVIEFKKIREQGLKETVAEIIPILSGNPIYLCWDMDFFDPSCAPGVFTPTWGGANSEDGLQLIQCLDGLEFIGFNINTVCPPHDVSGLTAHLAARILYEFLILLCKKME